MSVIPAHMMHPSHPMSGLINSAIERSQKVMADKLPPVQGVSGPASFRQLLINQHDSVPTIIEEVPRLPPADGKVNDVPKGDIKPLVGEDPEVQSKMPMHEQKEVNKEENKIEKDHQPDDNIAHYPMSGVDTKSEDESASDECECECHMCPVENGKYIPHECTDGPWCKDGKFDRSKVYEKAHKIKDKKGYSWNDALKEAWIIAKAAK